MRPVSVGMCSLKVWADIEDSAVQNFKQTVAPLTPHAQGVTRQSALTPPHAHAQLAQEDIVFDRRQLKVELPTRFFSSDTK